MNEISSKNISIAQWQEILQNKNAEKFAYEITKNAGTEYPHTGKYLNHWEAGNYNCIICDTPLFSSESKFESKCGWPSFSRAIENNTKETEDTSHGMIRTEITCKNCHSHLGHLFYDAKITPRNPSGARYCINSASLEFEKANL